MPLCATLAGAALFACLAADPACLPVEHRVHLGVLRAIAQVPEVQVAFQPGPSGLVGKRARLPLPTRALPAAEMAKLRGAADSVALRLRHHDDAVHAGQVALRVGREYTGGTAWIATSEAYHGNTALVSAHSPSLRGPEQMDPTLRIIDPPDTYRLQSETAEGAGAWWLGQLGAAIAEIEALLRDLKK